MLIRYIYFIVFVLFLFSEAASQKLFPAFRHFTKDQGLPTNNINEIFQDKAGYVWIATGEGLCRYDGYKYKNYHTLNDETDNNVRFIEQDNTGRIWFATLKNSIYYIENERIKPFRHNDKIRKSKGVFHDFRVNKAGNSLYIAMGRTGLIQMDTYGKYSIFPKKSKNSKAIFENKEFIISSFNNKEDAADTITWKPNTIEWHTTYGIKDIILDKKSLDGASHIFSAQIGVAGTIVVLGKKVFYFENQEYRWSTPLPVLKGLPFVDNDGSIYLGLMEGNGLRKYNNLEDLRLDKFSLILAGKSVTWIAEDKDNGMWVSTIDDGYYYLPNKHVYSFELPEAYRHKKIRSISVGINGQFFVGLTSGEIADINPYLGNFRLLPKCPYPTVALSVYYERFRNRLYAGTNYLQYFENEKWYATIKQNDRGIPCQFITYQDSNYIFCKTGQYGFLVDQKDISARQMQYTTNSVNMRVFAISKDSTVWVSTEKEILYKPKDKIEFRKPKPVNKAFDLPADYLKISNKGSVIFGGNTGFYYYNQNKTSHIIPKVEGFPGNDAKIMETPDGKIWVTSGKGCMVYKWHDEGYDEQYIGSDFGLPDQQIFDLAYYDNKIWFVTDKGIVSIPDTLYNHQQITPILEYFFVNDSLIDFEKNHRFSYDQNNITITLNTFNYRIAGRSLFRYRLHPSSPWQETTEKEIKLFSIQDGSYRLEVQAKNEENTWGPSLHIDFRIDPIFFKSWWFLSAVFIFLLSAGYGYYKFRINNIQKDAEVKAQIIGLERSALQAQMNPHFIFNCLTSIQNFILQNEKSQANQYLSTFASLVRDTLNASVDGLITLEDEIRMLESYLSLERLRFNYSFDYSIIAAPDIDKFDTVFPPLLIQPFVENAILHGVKNKEGKGEIKISFSLTNEHLLVVITDNGPGINASAKSEISFLNSEKNHQYKSLGVGITKKRLSHLNVNQNTQNLNITELKDNLGHVVGSEVRISVKL